MFADGQDGHFISWGLISCCHFDWHSSCNREAEHLFLWQENLHSSWLLESQLCLDLFLQNLIQDLPCVQLSLTAPSVQVSRSVVSDSVRPHESPHARPPCPSPSPRVHPNPCPSSQWCHPAISSSVIPFSSCPNPSQHQSLFQWVNSSHEVAKVLGFQL